ncbi:hypothetical protein [Burkholderia sp. PU8-34]
MKNQSTPPNPERTDDKASNVYVLLRHNPRSRHRAIRQFLRDLISRHEAASAVAVACVIVQSDGAVNISAKGMDSDLAGDVLAGLDRLSARIRHQISGNVTDRERQRGFAASIVLAALALSVSAYFNPFPWLDSLIVLTAHLIAKTTKQ